MYSYVVFIWDINNGPASRCAERLSATLQQTSRPWKQRVSTTGLRVFDVQPARGGLTAYVLPEGTGAIFGRLFSAGGSAVAQADLRTEEAVRIAASGGSSLVDRYWGSYVAVIRQVESRRTYVLRDCSGKLPCFRTRIEDVDVVFSNVLDLEVLGLSELRVNWTYVTAFLLESQLQVRDCGLEGIEEVLAGEQVIFDKGEPIQQTYWDPRRICQEGVIEDSSVAARQLRTTTQACVDAWASTHTSILHMLSGGFDSAVVLGCLMRAPQRPQVTCLNRFGDRPSEDERAHARAAAAQANVKLIEHTWEIGYRSFDDRLLSLPREVKPQIGSLVTFFETDLLNKMSRDLGFECVWTGQGGDHLFFALRTSVGANDFFRRHPFSRQLGTIILDTSRLTGDSLWHVARSMIASRHESEAALQLGGSHERSLVSKDAIPTNAAGYVLHPWLRDTRGVAKGKVVQMHFLSELLNRHRPVAGLEYEDEHHPLLSQPLMELCLRIPIYLLVGGGRTRALARDAFRDIVPQQIRDREGKGETTNFMVALFRRNQSFIREMLLDGVLMKQHILDRAVTDAVLKPNRPLRPEDLYPVLSTIAAEAFARAWTERRAPLDRARTIAVQSSESLAPVQTMI
jgi:asparagine synthase (glutamine-hydrolysing)